MAQSYFYANLAVPAAIGNTGGISSSATSVFCSAVPSGYPGQYPFKLVLAAGGATEEIVKVTAGSGTSASPWTIVRAWDGTTAQAQGQGATITHMATAEDYTLSRQHEALTTNSGVHGLPNSAWTAGSFAVINETTLANSTTAAVTWSSIPATYTHLMVIAQGKLTESTLQSDDIAVTLNGDTGAHYSYVTLHATNISGSGVGALSSGAFTGFAGANWPLLRLGASQSGAAANGGGGWALLPNYTSATFNKSFYSQSGAGDGSTAMVDMRIRSGWFNPASQAAITSMTLTAPGSGFFVTGTFLGLYGLS